MRKLGLFATIAMLLISFPSCEKVEPTELETSTLENATLSGYVYFNKLDDDGKLESIKVFEGKSNVIVEVTELGANDKATGNVMIVTTTLKAGKFEVNIPIAAGKKAKCKTTCIFEQQNYDLKTTADDKDFKNTLITYKGEANVTLTYGETIYVELMGVKVGSLDDPYHFLN